MSGGLSYRSRVAHQLGELAQKIPVSCHVSLLHVPYAYMLLLLEVFFLSDKTHKLFPYII